MILTDDGRAISPEYIPDPPTKVVGGVDILMEIHNETTHFQLKLDIIEHVHANLIVELTDDENEDN
jgi:hypothetical protein